MNVERGDISVGATLLIAGVLAVSAWLWLTRPNDDYFALFVEYDRVESLSEQTPVRLQGFAVGRIQAIEPLSTPEGSVVFRVELRIEDRFMGDSALFIPQGTVARVQYPPVVGTPYIVLEPPAEGGAPLTAGSQIPGLRTEPFLDQIQVLTGQLSFTVTETLMRATQLMDSIESTLGRLDQTIDAAEGGVPEVIANLNRSILAAEELTAKVDAELGVTTPALRASLDSASAVIGDARRLINDAERMIETTSPKADKVLANLDSTTFMLNHFITRISQRPLRLFTGVGPPPRRPAPEPLIRPDSIP